MRSRKVAELMRRSIYNSSWARPAEMCDTILSIAGLVEGMTDYAAIDLYRKLHGIEFPNY